MKRVELVSMMAAVLYAKLLDEDYSDYNEDGSNLGETGQRIQDSVLLAKNILFEAEEWERLNAIDRETRLSVPKPTIQ